MMENLFNDMRRWADAYIKSFYTEDTDIQEKVRLKETHTAFVVDISAELARHLGLGERDAALAKIIGLFHDIGRFKQYSVYRTFNDFASENHALLGLREIERLDLLLRLPKEDLGVFRFAVANHNAVQIAETDDPRRLLFAKIIRDADKLDIYRVLAPTIFPSDGSGYSQAFAERFLSGGQCDYAAIQTSDERKLVRLSWIYNVNFSWTLQKIMERGYVRQIASCLPKDEVMARGMEKLTRYINERTQVPDAPVFAEKARNLSCAGRNLEEIGRI